MHASLSEKLRQYHQQTVRKSIDMVRTLANSMTLCARTKFVCRLCSAYRVFGWSPLNFNWKRPQKNDYKMIKQIQTERIFDREAGIWLNLYEKVGGHAPVYGFIREADVAKILISGATAYHPDTQLPASFIYDTYVSAIAKAGGLPLLALGFADAGLAENERTDAPDTLTRAREFEHPGRQAAYRQAPDTLTRSMEFAIDPDNGAKVLAAAYAADCDGLLLPGISHFAADENLVKQLKVTQDPKKERFDEALYRAFKSARKPVLGICLGLQMINLWEGGTLKIDIKGDGGMEHMLVSHMANIRGESFLSGLVPAVFRVNSRHNDCIDRLSRNLNADAVSPDACIEAVSHKSLPIYALQWHPERMQGKYREPSDGADMSPLFKWWVGLCGRSF